MRVVSIYELRRLPRRSALERLKRVDFVLDEEATLVPSEEFSRILENSGSVHKKLTHKHKVVRA
ncbi:hypothetical protein [Thermococcus nautili]|uniref:Uncharacterized protein n=1 Tax=Thermococcus nautili TaxID=195522 RepID=U3RGX5_9EURY|nr:hypothetical protein [Thermococcus nautili]AGX15324.1 hypothetical protein TNaP3-10 [Thermococcus nautili]AHL21649.1 hypothetical protein BD01_0010 [Thermococcus nautili]